MVTILDTIIAKTACNNGTSCYAKWIVIVESFQTHRNMVVEDSISKAILLPEFLCVAKVGVEVLTTDYIDAKECKACDKPLKTGKYRVRHFAVLSFAFNKLLIIREFKENPKAS